MSSQNTSPDFESLRQRTVVCRLPERGVLEVTGADAASFLNSFCTNDIKRLAAGEGCEAFFTSLQGKSLALAWLFRVETGVIVDCGDANAAALLSHLDRYLIMEKAKLKDRTHDTASWLVVGPQARERLKSLFNVVPADVSYAHAPAAFGDATIELRDVRAAWPGGTLVVARTTLASELERAFATAAIESAAADWAETLRIENQFPANGREVTEERLPQEMLRDATAISFTKGCYLGQETIARLDALGHVNWHLVRIDFPKSAITAPGSPEQGSLTGQSLTGPDGKPGGQITSVGPQATGETLATLAIVRRTLGKPGQTLLAGELAGLVVGQG